jgi:phage-related protein
MQPDTLLKIEHHRDGKFYEIYFVILLKGGFLEFIDSLGEDDTGKLASLFNNICKIEVCGEGVIRNQQKVRHTGDDMWELKLTRSTVRFPFFYMGRSIVITHGYFKTAKKRQTREIELAKDIRKRVEGYNEKQ